MAESESKQRWMEPIIAVMMGFATLATAWCSYESAAWTRRSNRLMNEFNSLERKAGILELHGMQMATLQVAMFMHSLAAKEAGNEALAQFYVDRFSPELRKAYDAWLAKKPFENPQAEKHPFEPSLYEMPGSREAEEASSKADACVQDARNAGNASGQYLANTVLFATVLFFSNAAGKFQQRPVRLVSFLFAVTVFSAAVLRLALLPR